MTKYVNVKQYKRPIGRNCMRCGKAAKVIATKKMEGSGYTMDVHYCLDHAIEGGVIKE
jgi:hypothetical protein